MATAATIPSDETLDILRPLAPAPARLDGRVTGMEGQLRQLPTLWPLAGPVVAIFGSAFALPRFAS
jgi:hypothetical protein